ncbi:MAG TPA: VOC family protein [Actinospica sp.]|jgi:hypothetical protein|nr:VOC family protein [Actinospica sp.]
MIRWVYAFIDRPKAHFEQAAEFWTAATGTTLSPRRGPGGEFATLGPPTRSHRDACVKIQGVADGPGGAHIDLAVEDVRALAARAVELGARIVLEEDDDLVVLTAPGGHLFCAVRWHGETRRPDVFEGTRLDQVSLDIAPDDFEAAGTFWGELTGWPVLSGRHAEFRVVRPEPQLPVRILLQRLDTPSHPGAAHIDFACRDRAATRIAHEKLGAAFEAEFPNWIVMRDPSGAPYCLTARDPRTGSLT